MSATLLPRLPEGWFPGTGDFTTPIWERDARGGYALLEKRVETARREQSFIYALKDPRDEVVRYVGKSDVPKQRYRQHLRNTDSEGNRVQRWLAELEALGLSAEMVVLEAVSSPYEKMLVCSLDRGGLLFLIERWRIAEARQIERHWQTVLNITHDTRVDAGRRAYHLLQWREYKIGVRSWES